jgi:hypothetical protein
LVPVPVVFHDPDRELVLAFVPNAQEMDEQSLGQVIGPVLQSFITSVPEERQAEYLFHPIVTDDHAALQAAARGELLSDSYAADDEDDQDDEDDEDDDHELSPEEQRQMSQRVELLQTLFESPDSLQRISTLRQYKFLVDDLFQQMIEILLQQALQNQPEIVPALQKIMNEVEVFQASNPD